RGGIVDRARSGQLLGFLAVLPPALAVALARDHCDATALAANVPSGESDVDQGQYVFDALRLMLDAARVHGDGALGGGEPASRALDGIGRHSGPLSRHAGIVWLN